jgi:hypothetical protein
MSTTGNRTVKKSCDRGGFSVRCLQRSYTALSLRSQMRGQTFLEGDTTVAKRTIHVLVDDIDGGDADETVKFALDGVQYEIDLSKKNASKLRDAFSPFLAAGTKLGRGGVVVGGRAATARVRGGAAADREQNKAIREWAQGKGIPVSDRGRIKQEIVERFNAEAGR